MTDIILVNNTGVDIRLVEKTIIDCIKTNRSLPEELADLFVLEVKIVGGSIRGFLNMA